MDNHNNMLANEQINASIARYMAFLDYICNNKNLENFTLELTNYMGRPRKQPQQNTETIDVFEIIEDAITNNKS
ncbi:MAG: hypothetical protein K2K92_01930, partial [Duncaniella sp.]|nr:hypothetical protein [Duncaniella sp.]